MQANVKMIISLVRFHQMAYFCFFILHKRQLMPLKL
jgi:hypothetical protein